MPDAKYAYITAYLKGQEAKVLTSEHFNRLFKVTTIQDALMAIRDTSVGAYLEGSTVGTFDDVDKILWRYLGESIAYLERFRLLPKDISIILKSYVGKYDVSNIKVALQGIATGREFDMIPIGVIYDNNLLDELSAARDTQYVASILNQCKLKDYASIVENYLIEGDLKSRLFTETRLDNIFYQNLKKIVSKLGDSSTLKKAVGAMIDMTNLQIIMRAIIEGSTAQAADYLISGGFTISNDAAREMLSIKLSELPVKLSGTPYFDALREIATEYEKTGNIAVIEEIMNRHGFRLARETLGIKLLTPATALWYLVLKESEVRSLRLTLKAIIDKVPLDEIKSIVVFAS